MTTKAARPRGARAKTAKIGRGVVAAAHVTSKGVRGTGAMTTMQAKSFPRHGGGGAVIAEDEWVTIQRAAYERLLARLEDLEDARDLAAAAAAAKPEDYLPAAAMKRIIAGEHPLRVWREHRGLTASALAERAGIPVSYVSEIETKRKPGSIAAYKALAEALGLAIDDLAP